MIYKEGNRPASESKLREMQQHTHGLVQIIRAATLDVPNQTPMPQLSKQAQCVLNFVGFESISPT